MVRNRVALATASLLAISPFFPQAAALETAETLAAAGEIAVDIVPEGAGSVSADSPAAAAIVTRIGADTWHAAGHTGGGVTIGVIDFADFTAYWNASLGPAPSTADVKCLAAGTDCSATFFDGADRGGESHGPAVAAVLRTVAPGARLVFGRAQTMSDYRALIDWFADEGVTIVNRSLGARYDGPGDGRGPLDEVADYAVSLGMLWVNSGGNNGAGQYYREPVTVADGWVDFGGSRYLAFEGTAQPAGIRWAGDWDVPVAERSDYDVYLYRAPDGHPERGTLVASSTRRQSSGADPLETIIGSFTPADGERMYLAVEYVGGGATTGDVLEVLDYGDGIVGATDVAGSAATPIVDSTNPGVMSVGAIDPPATGEIASYSAQGPTTDGRVVPTLSAPTGYANSVWGRFSGTSAGAAVVSGAAALIRGAGLADGPAELAALLVGAAVDHGPAGPDNEFGAGEVRLPQLSGATAGATAAGTSRYVPVTPARLVDTRQTVRLAAGERRDVQVTGVAGVARTGVTAVAVNVTTVAPDQAGFVQLLAAGRGEPASYSNVNTDAGGQVRANLAIVPVGADGAISMYASGAGDVVIDVLGYFTATDQATAGGRLVRLDQPQRTLDTRASAPIASGERRAIPLPSGVASAHVAGLVVTVTGTQATQPGWVQAYPTGQPDVVGTTSTINLGPGENVANLAIVPVEGGASVAAYFANGGRGHVIVDVVGYITSDAAPVSTSGLFVSLSPFRAYDSSRPLVGREQARVAPEGVPTSASAVVLNLTVVGADRAGFARVWSPAEHEPATSALNWSAAGEIRAASAITAVSGAAGALVLDDGGAAPGSPLATVLADAFGYFT